MKSLIKRILKETSSGFKSYDTITNRYMSKRFSWWKNLETNSYSYGTDSPKIITWYGTLTVDKDWYNDLCDKSPFSDCEAKDGIRIDLLVDTDTILDITHKLEKMYLMFYGEKKYLRIRNSIKIKPEEQETIVSESSNNYRDKVLNLIEKIGLFKTLKMLGTSYIQLFADVVSPEYFSRKVKLKFIKDYFNGKQYGIGLSEIGEDPIRYGERDGEFMEITFLGLSTVWVNVFDSDTMESKGDFRLMYDNLSDDIIDVIFVIILQLNNDEYRYISI